MNIDEREKKLTLKEKIKEEISKSCRNTTSHGISHSANSEYRSIKIIWLLVFVASTAYSSYLIARSLIKFYKYETTISIIDVHELPAKFPAVTICNINPINEKYAENYTRTKIKEYNCFDTAWLKAQNYSNLQKCLNTNDTAASFDTIIDKIKREMTNLNDKERYYYGFDLDKDMLVSCKYNSESCNDTELYWYKYWTNENGNCYTFNSGKDVDIIKTGDSGAKYGLKLELVVSKLNHVNHTLLRSLFGTGSVNPNSNLKPIFFKGRREVPEHDV
jgi:hypothetical protein